MDLLRWADANESYHMVTWDKKKITEEMLLFRCIGGRSRQSFDAYLVNTAVSPQFLEKLVEVRRSRLVTVTCCPAFKDLFRPVKTAQFDAKLDCR